MSGERAASGDPARDWSTRLRSAFGARSNLGLDESVRNLRITARVFALFGTIGLAFVFSVFHAQFGPAGAALSGATLFTYALWYALAQWWRRAEQFLRMSLTILIVLGALWGAIVFVCAEVANGPQTIYVLFMAMALVSTPMLGAPVNVALAFWTPAAIGAAFAIGSALQPFDPGLALSFVGFEAFTLVGLVFINTTLREKSEAQAALLAQNATIGLLLRDYEESAADWLWETDHDDCVRAVTPRFAQVLRQQVGRAEGKPLVRVLALDRKHDPSADVLLRAIGRRDSFQMLPIKLVIAGEERWWSLTGRPVVTPSGVYQGFRGVGSDITEARRAEEAARYMARHDILTRVGNRRMFHEAMSEACAPAVGDGVAGPFALMLVDLDRFKTVNDDHGHEVGDQVLIIVAERLRRSIRPGDRLARLGGDEFAIIMPGAGAREAEARAKQLIAAVTERIHVNEAWLGVGASVGVALFPEHGTETSEIARNADLALYRAKEAGKGACQLFQTSFSQEYEERVTLLAELRAAIDADALTVWYQPIVDLQSGNAVSMEALCRWSHPERGMIPPSIFIPLAEEAGLIGRLGYRVLERSCREAVDWDPPISVSVNLSPLQLTDPNLAANVAQVLSETGLPPERLQLEVTESAWLRGDDQTRSEMERLEALGAKIVLDDFGTGFSSLSTLHSFRFDGLKIDADFTRDLARDPKAGAIIRLVAGLAAELGMTLTAEGIESQRQLDIVRSFGIARAQGYLFGRPAPPEQIAA